MNWIKGFALVTCLATPLPVITAAAHAAEAATESKTATETKTATDTKMAKKPTKSQIEAFQTKCSMEADSKGLKGKAKAEERKSFRAGCIKKLSSDGM